MTETTEDEPEISTGWYATSELRYKAIGNQGCELQQRWWRWRYRGPISLGSEWEWRFIKDVSEDEPDSGVEP